MNDRIETLHMIVKYDVLALVTKLECYCEQYGIKFNGLDIFFKEGHSLKHVLHLNDDKEDIPYE